MDRRDVVARTQSVFQQVERARLLAVFVDPNGEPHAVKIRYEVCGTCEGRGTHVNPNIDRQGLSADDFAEDPGFEEDYFSGLYDVECHECKGERLVVAVDEDANPPELVQMIRKHIEDMWAHAQEMVREIEMGY